jgi:hypothetical protein
MLRDSLACCFRLTDRQGSQPQACFRQAVPVRQAYQGQLAFPMSMLPGPQAAATNHHIQTRQRTPAPQRT